MEISLNYGGDSKTNQLFMALFYTPGKTDIASPVADAADANMGLKTCYTFTRQSRIVDMTGPIDAHTFFQERFLLNGVNLRLKLIRARNAFCLVSSGPGPNFKVIITKAILYVRKVKVTSTIALRHAAALRQATAK